MTVQELIYALETLPLKFRQYQVEVTFDSECGSTSLTDPPRIEDNRIVLPGDN